MLNAVRIPIIKLYDSLIVSIQTSLSDSLVLTLKDDITAKIDQTGVHGLIIDLSGINLMDSYITRAVRDIGLIARLMGVETVISGMDPIIASTLVEMDIGLEGVLSVLNLETAVELLKARHEEREIQIIEELFEL